MERLLTAPEIAQILQVSKAKVYMLISQKEIPYIRIGRNVRVRENDLLDWINKQAVKKQPHLGFV